MKKSIFTILILISFSSSQHIDCVGCSITRNGYPGVTNNLMIANGYEWRVHNYGVPGAGVVQSAYKNKSKYTEVICREAEIVVLLLGANDWGWYSVADQSGKDNWEVEYRKLVTEFGKNSTVVLGYLIHRVSVNGNDVTLANATMDKMNIVIKSIANSYGLPIIDFKTAIGTDPAHFWTSDGLHPNNLGSELMGIAAYEYLKTLVPMGRKIKNCDPVVTIEKMDFDWVQIEDKIRFQWSAVNEATHYKLSKAHKVGGSDIYWWNDTITNTEYWDSDFIYDYDYFCDVKAYKHSNLIGETPKRTVRYYEYLSIDDEYWESVEDYDNQKPSLFNGCSMKRMK